MTFLSSLLVLKSQMHTLIFAHVVFGLVLQTLLLFFKYAEKVCVTNRITQRHSPLEKKGQLRSRSINFNGPKINLKSVAWREKNVFENKFLILLMVNSS